jgi:hypothetical protein
MKHPKHENYINLLIPSWQTSYIAIETHIATVIHATQEWDQIKGFLKNSSLVHFIKMSVNLGQVYKILNLWDTNNLEYALTIRSG